MTAENIQLPDAEELLKTLAHKLQPLLRPNKALVGIQSGGVWLMHRLITLLESSIAEHVVESGTLDVSFYRDDYAKRGLKAETRPSQIPFEVEDKHIILIDDVFYTGRTTRAAVNELFDYGRPASVTLVALVNRGGRELPLAPQIIAADIPVPASQNLQLIQNPNGTLSLALINLATQSTNPVQHTHE